MLGSLQVIVYKFMVLTGIFNVIRDLIICKLDFKQINSTRSLEYLVPDFFYLHYLYNIEKYYTNNEGL